MNDRQRENTLAPITIRKGQLVGVSPRELIRLRAIETAARELYAYLYDAFKTDSYSTLGVILCKNPVKDETLTAPKVEALRAKLEARP